MFWNRKLTNQNVLAYASAHYYNNKIGWNEFYDDYAQFKRLNGMFAKLYIEPTFEQLRTIINRIIMLSNCFEGDSFGRLCFFFTNKESHSDLYTILSFLKRLPETTYETSNDKMQISQKVAQMLQKL